MQSFSFSAISPVFSCFLRLSFWSSGQKIGFCYSICCALPTTVLTSGPSDRRTQRKKQWGFPYSLGTAASLTYPSVYPLLSPHCCCYCCLLFVNAWVLGYDRTKKRRGRNKKIIEKGDFFHSVCVSGDSSYLGSNLEGFVIEFSLS